MGHQSLSPSPALTLLDRIRAYPAHPDPATAMANFVAVLIAWNGPFYPLYIVGLIGLAGSALVPLTMVATPFFLAIPALSRRSSLAARLALPVIGTLNTVWCTKLLGAGSGIGTFLLPCVALAALLHRRNEQPALLVAIALPLAAYFIPDSLMGTPLVTLTTASTARLEALNFGSVMTLMAVLAFKFAGLLRTVEAG